MKCLIVQFGEHRVMKVGLRTNIIRPIGSLTFKDVSLLVFFHLCSQFKVLDFTLYPHLIKEERIGEVFHVRCDG